MVEMRIGYCKLGTLFNLNDHYRLKLELSVGQSEKMNSSLSFRFNLSFRYLSPFFLVFFLSLFIDFLCVFVLVL